MRAVILTGLVVCLASVAYAHGTDKDKTGTTSSTNAGKSTTGKRAALEKDQNIKPLNAAETALLNDLHAANLTEVAAGQLAEKQSDSDAVKRYGRTLVKDHGAADRKLSALAKRKNASLTSVAHPLAELGGRKGADFDSAFLTMMVKDHGEAIAMVKRGRENCEDKDVRAFLDQIQPTLEKHQSEAVKLQQLAQAR